MNPPTRFLPLLILFVLLFLSGGSTVLGGDALSHDVLAASSDQCVFVARVQKTDGGERTSIIGRRLGGDQHWRRLIDLNRRVLSLSARGEDAIVLLDNGDWVTVWENGSPLGPVPAQTRLIALAADRSPDRYVLWAVGITAAPTTTAPTTTALTTTTPTTTAPTTTLTTTTASTHATTVPIDLPPGPALFKFEGNHWSRIATLPAEITSPASADLSLAIVGHVPVLTVASDAKHLGSWSFTGADWSSSPAVVTGNALRAFRVIETSLPPSLWYTTGGPGVLVSATTSSQIALSDDGFPTSDPRSAALAAETLRVYCLSADKLYEQAYQRDGKPMDKPREVIAQIPLQDSPFQGWLAPGITAALTLMVLSAARQTPPINPEILESAGVALAPLGRRFAAGAIDASPILLATAWAVYKTSQLEVYTAVPPPRVVLPLYIAITFYLIYMLTAEMLRGRTVGKWLFGLQIVTLTGTPPDGAALLMRNLMRLIDVMVMGLPLVLILFSPLRQRFGDVAAGTVIVVKASDADDSAA